MASIQDLIYELQFIKQKSDELESSTKYDSERLQQVGSKISAIAQGSRSGEEAMQTIAVALRSLSLAIGSMRALSRECDKYMEKLRQ